MNAKTIPDKADRKRRKWGSMGGGPILAGGNIRCEASERVRAIGWGGLGLIQRVVSHPGLAESIDDRLKVLERHLPYRESDHVLSLVLNVLTGGRCLQDGEAKRTDPIYLRAVGAERLPAPSTSGDFLRRFEPAHVRALESAADEARVRAWSSLGDKRLGRAVIDVDGSLAKTDGECKEGIGRSHDGHWGYMTLVVSLSNTGEVLRTLNRPGNRPSHEGAAEKISEAAAVARRGGFREVLVRGDTDFALTRHFDEWHGRGIRFVFGKDAAPGLKRRARALDESRWLPLHRPRKRTGKRKGGERVKERIVVDKGYLNRRLEAEHVAEFPWRPARSSTDCRLVILRKSVSAKRGQRLLFDETRYFFYITNLSKEEASAAQVVRESNRRCAQEKVIEQLKNGVSAMRMPSDGLVSNWAWMSIAAQAWNLKAWMGLLLPAELGARKLLTMHFRRFLLEVVQVPCQILEQGRRLIFRLLSRNEWTPLLTRGCDWLRRAAPG